MTVVKPHNVGTDHGISEAHAEYVYHLIELKSKDEGFIWEYSTSKKLHFTKPSKRGFPSSVWATVPANLPEAPEAIKWSINTISSTRGIIAEAKIESETPERLEVLINMVPPPEEGDHVEYTTNTASRYINPVWKDEVTSNSLVHLNDGDFVCADGLIFIHRTKKGILEFRFPREYGLRRSEIHPFVGSYTSSVDYEVESELTRATVKTEDFGGSISVRMEIESPLPGHLYGIAWNPKDRPLTETPHSPPPAALPLASAPGRPAH
jgi:hypothetical protein